MNWPVVPLGEVARSVDYGVTASASDRPVGPKFLRITDIQDDAVNWDSVPYCVAQPGQIVRSRLADGDIVFARTGATTGKSFLVRDPPNEAVFASYLIRVRPNERLDPVFLSHFFRSPNYWSQIEKAARGAAQPGVNASVLKELVIPLPTLLEQRRVATILDKAYAIQRKRKCVLVLANNLLNSVFLMMFGDPALNPNRFLMKPLGELAQKFSDGPFGSNLKSSHYTSEGVRVVRLQNIGVGQFIDEDKAFISETHFNDLRKHECLPGDILVGTMGDPNLRACRLPTEIGRALNKADCVQIRPDESQVLSDYICALLNQPSAEKMAHGLILGQTRARISMGRLKTLEVPVPPVTLQRDFENAVRQVSAIRASLLGDISNAHSLFKSLSQRAFRGTL